MNLWDLLKPVSRWMKKQQVKERQYSTSLDGFIGAKFPAESLTHTHTHCKQKHDTLRWLPCGSKWSSAQLRSAPPFTRRRSWLDSTRPVSGSTAVWILQGEKRAGWPTSGWRVEGGAAGCHQAVYGSQPVNRSNKSVWGTRGCKNRSWCSWSSVLGRWGGLVWAQSRSDILLINTHTCTQCCVSYRHKCSGRTREVWRLKCNKSFPPVGNSTGMSNHLIREVKGAVCSFGDVIKTQNFTIYNINEVITQEKFIFSIS